MPQFSSFKNITILIYSFYPPLPLFLGLIQSPLSKSNLLPVRLILSHDQIPQPLFSIFLFLVHSFFWKPTKHGVGSPYAPNISLFKSCKTISPLPFLEKLLCCLYPWYPTSHHLTSASDSMDDALSELTSDLPRIRSKDFFIVLPYLGEPCSLWNSSFGLHSMLLPQSSLPTLSLFAFFFLPPCTSPKFFRGITHSFHFGQGRGVWEGCWDLSKWQGKKLLHTQAWSRLAETFWGRYGGWGRSAYICR